MAPARRRFHVTSRFVRADGPHQPWTAAEATVDLPVIVNWVEVNVATGEEHVRVEAKADLVDGSPEIVEMTFLARDGLDLSRLQQDFRWASPLNAVTGILPGLIASGSDPFDVDLPIHGYPAVAIQPVRRRGNLTDEFLTTIAREYLARGRGYATSLAAEYFVTPRTVVSWVEKARARRILSAAPGPGAAGGHLVKNPQTGSVEG